MPRSAVPVLLAVLLALTGCEFEWQVESGPPERASSVGQGDVPEGTLDPAAASAALVDLLQSGETPVSGQGTVEIGLDGYGYRWLRVVAEDSRRLV